MTNGIVLNDIEIDSRRCSKCTGNDSVRANAAANTSHGTCNTCGPAAPLCTMVRTAATAEAAIANATTGPTAGAVGPGASPAVCGPVLMSAAGPAPARPTATGPTTARPAP